MEQGGRKCYLPIVFTNEKRVQRGQSDEHIGPAIAGFDQLRAVVRRKCATSNDVRLHERSVSKVTSVVITAAVHLKSMKKVYARVMVLSYHRSVDERRILVVLLTGLVPAATACGCRSSYRNALISTESEASDEHCEQSSLQN